MPFKHIGRIFLIRPDKLSSEEINFYKDLNFKNFIFFREHFENFDFREYLETLKGVKNLGLLAVDQEGGKVCRIPGDFASPLEIALSFKENKEEKSVINWARKIVEALKRFSLNLNLAPCVDLGEEEVGEFLRKRTFGSDPDLVKKMALIFISEHEKWNIYTCIKHFPGLDQVTVDPHLSLPFKEEITEKALDVFNDLKSKVKFIMTTHIVITKLDTLPVTFSQKVVNFIREKMDYKYIIVTDDINMGALKEWELQERVLLSLASGHNLIIYCGSWQELCSVVFDIKSEIEKSKVLREKILESLYLIDKVKV